MRRNRTQQPPIPVCDGIHLACAAAKAAGIPVIGVYETMPTPGYDYQSWMMGEVNALNKAVADGVSTQRL